MSTELQNTDVAGVRIDPDLSPWVSAESWWIPTRVVVSAWLEHGPFAQWIMAAIRPKTVVELGTHNGFSFFTFCESARRLRLATKAWALDTWQGDDHAGFYGEDIYADVDAVRRESYADMAVLLRGYFADSVDSFPDASIELLHIDGRHGYEDVKEDFESWLPKVASNGIVLFHDIAEHKDDFGVWRLWDELRVAYPSFTFEHGHGLGVLAVGSEIPEGIRALFETTDEQADAVRAFYSARGKVIEATWLRDLEVTNMRAEIGVLTNAVAELRADVGALQGTLSWRVTRPLRGVRRVLRR